jgi:hypothetical protein
MSFALSHSADEKRKAERFFSVVGTSNTVAILATENRL